MSKSILVIDTPEKCDGCVLHGIMIGKQICNAEIKRVKDENSKPDWCPFRDLPEKYEPVSMDFERGFNTCIDEILKEVFNNPILYSGDNVGSRN